MYRNSCNFDYLWQRIAAAAITLTSDMLPHCIFTAPKYELNICVAIKWSSFSNNYKKYPQQIVQKCSGKEFTVTIKFISFEIHRARNAIQHNFNLYLKIPCNIFSFFKFIGKCITVCMRGDVPFSRHSPSQ